MVDSNSLVPYHGEIVKRCPFHLVRLDRYHKPTHATTNKPRIRPDAFAAWRLKCQAWNSGCAPEAGLIGRRLRPPSFMCLTGLRALTDRFNRPRRRHSDRGLDSRVIPEYFFREQVYFVFLLSAVQRFFRLLFKVFQDGWGFTDLAAKPAPFRFSTFYVSSTEKSRVTHE